MLRPLADQDQRLIGSKVNTRNWPSTAYMAAMPWIKEGTGNRWGHLLDYHVIKRLNERGIRPRSLVLPPPDRDTRHIKRLCVDLTGEIHRAQRPGGFAAGVDTVLHMAYKVKVGSTPCARPNWRDAHAARCRGGCPACWSPPSSFGPGSGTRAAGTAHHCEAHRPLPRPPNARRPRLAIAAPSRDLRRHGALVSGAPLVCCRSTTSWNAWRCPRTGRPGRGFVPVRQVPPQMGSCVGNEHALA
jgi:hypothetical protein